ncbi:hemoglobin subunit beta-Y isoform X2 [Halyomorpha halys]
MLVFKNFFGDYPSTIKYFKRFGNDPETIMKHATFIDHAKKNVFNSLDKTIGILDEPEEIKKIELWIGKVHRSKRISREDFLSLGNSIVKSVKLALGDQCTEEDEEAWQTVIGALMSAFAESSSK